ncbi:HRSL4 protein, partial [Polyodon spathula]|nr:HRSL4 protein [Polyodon spathula]
MILFSSSWPHNALSTLCIQRVLSFLITAAVYFPQKFNVGDIISFSRGLYHHWGVYYGQEDGKNYVVSVSGESNSKPLAITSKLVKEELNKVAGKSEYSVYRELDKHNEPRSPEQMKADMDKMIGTKIKYDPFEKNCQHFATKIRYGKEISPEVIMHLFLDNVLTVMINKQNNVL